MRPVAAHVGEPGRARSAGEPEVRARARVLPEDFLVEEELGFAPDGVGEHVWLRIRKRGCNTEWVARELARHARVAPSAVGYAGLKDRRAVAVQWFSVHIPGAKEPTWGGLADACTVIEHARHRRKLRRGSLRGNRFRILLRDLRGPWGDLRRRVGLAARRGVPNYFGPQRFGHDGANVTEARAWFSGAASVRGRFRRGLYLSAARARVFNALLERRVTGNSWEHLMPGELAMLDGTHSVFAVERPDAGLEARALRQDLHPTGPLWGCGAPAPTGACAALEREVAEVESDLCRGLERAGVRAARRALRAHVGVLALERTRQGALLEFRLPAGAYATAVLRELVRLED